jgi:ribosomal protein S18 acetylase RimI-like enzyme
MRAESAPDIVRIAEESDLSYWSEQDYLAEIGRRGSFALQAESESRKIAAGFVIMRLIMIYDDYNPSVFEILNIAVKKNYRKTGLGTKLINAAIEIAKQNSPANIWLEVRSSNKIAIGFYERHGFTAEYLRRSFHSHPVEDGIVMKLGV